MPSQPPASRPGWWPPRSDGGPAPARLAALPEWLLAMTEPDWSCGCLVWTGKVDKDGYGRVGGKMLHRVAWKAVVGDIADDITLDHVRDRGCRSSACWAPWHLEPVTEAENLRRAGRVGRANRTGPRGRTEIPDSLVRQLREDGLSYEEIARQTGLSKTAVRNRIARDLPAQS